MLMIKLTAARTSSNKNPLWVNADQIATVQRWHTDDWTCVQFQGANEEFGSVGVNETPEEIASLIREAEDVKRKQEHIWRMRDADILTAYEKQRR